MTEELALSDSDLVITLSGPHYDSWVCRCAARRLMALTAECDKTATEMNRALAEADMHRHDADSLDVRIAGVEAERDHYRQALAQMTADWKLLNAQYGGVVAETGAQIEHLTAERDSAQAELEIAYVDILGIESMLTTQDELKRKIVAERDRLRVEVAQLTYELDGLALRLDVARQEALHEPTTPLPSPLLPGVRGKEAR